MSETHPLTAITDHVLKLAQRAVEETDSSRAEQYANAARLVAEAGAWMKAPGSSH